MADKRVYILISVSCSNIGQLVCLLRELVCVFTWCVCECLSVCVCVCVWCVCVCVCMRECVCVCEVLMIV